MRPVLKRLTDAELRKFCVSRTLFTSPKSIAKNSQQVCHYCEKKFKFPCYLETVTWIPCNLEITERVLILFSNIPKINVL